MGELCFLEFVFYVLVYNEEITINFCFIKNIQKNNICKMSENNNYANIQKEKNVLIFVKIAEKSKSKFVRLCKKCK